VEFVLPPVRRKREKEALPLSNIPSPALPGGEGTWDLEIDFIIHGSDSLLIYFGSINF
jgi:hypothetical protein